MSPGRCSGCGYTSASCKSVQQHMLHCKDVAALYKSNSDAVLDPTKEYERFKLEEEVPAKAAKKAEFAAMRAERKAGNRAALDEMELYFKSLDAEDEEETVG